MKFDGLIVFEETNGCMGNAYRIVQGVVMSKLANSQTNQANPRCGETYLITTQYWQISGGTETFLGNGPSRTVTETCSLPPTVPSYDSGMNGSTTSTGGGISSDPTYVAFLGQYQIDMNRRLCQNSFTFKRIAGIVKVNGVNVTIDRIEAGLRNDGVLLNSPTGPVPIGFNYVTFQLPTTNAAYTAINTPNRILANAINLTVNQVQQQLMTGGINAADAISQFWGRVANNIASALGENPNEKYSYPSNSAVPYRLEDQGITITPIYNVPITTGMAGCHP